MSLTQQRVSAAMLLTTKPSDALASYFALEHDEKRTKLTVREDERGRTLAFVAVCQTGIDLFRPLVIARGDDMRRRARCAEGGVDAAPPISFQHTRYLAARFRRRL
ncbi:MAG: hypothetical protein HC853_05195 [Anaerolineae bacterium]|nr:hypothetical protein [Anaerolineae bacterium]